MVARLRRRAPVIDYATLEAFHVTAVALSGTLFALRGAWRLARRDAAFAYIVNVAFTKSPAGALRVLG